MNLFKFVCAQPDEDGNEIPNSGCGEIDCIDVDLYGYFYHNDGDLFVSVRNDGTVFFTEEQKESLPRHFSEPNIIEMVKESVERVNMGGCPNCGWGVYIRPIKR